MDTEKQDNEKAQSSNDKQRKPIVEQMTDLAAAGPLSSRPFGSSNERRNPFLPSSVRSCRPG